MTTAFSGGIGGNQPYAATTVDIDRNWFDVKAGYITAGNQFRRITTPSVFVAEPDRENARISHENRVNFNNPPLA